MSSTTARGAKGERNNGGLEQRAVPPRTQPAIDLAAKISVENPLEIIDIGCGPGNSTRVLKNRFPNANVTGADSSENMLEAARRENPDCKFIFLDAGGDLSELAGKFDVVFSNACIQWVPDHE